MSSLSSCHYPILPQDWLGGIPTADDKGEQKRRPALEALRCLARPIIASGTV
jgi:hypothetical protein